MTKNLLALLLSSTSLVACAPDTIESVIDQAGAFEQPPAEHGPTPVGDPGEQEIGYRDGSLWSCKTQRISLQENPERFMTLNPNADIIYPGALVQGASLASGSPEPIPVRRGAGKIVLALVTGADTAFQAPMDEVTQGNAIDAQNQLLAGVQDDAIPAKFVYDYEMYDSTEKLAASMDVKVEWLSGSSVHAASEFSSESHKTYALIRLTQEYFTTTFDMPTSVGAFFHPDVTPEELAEYTGPGNPAAYISSVTYGRQFYLVFESSASKQDLQAAVDAVYSGFVVDASGSLKAEYHQTQKQTKVRVFAIGGDAETALATAAAASNTDSANGMFEQVSAYLKKGGTFSTSNPGLPVSYTVRDVARRSVVKVNLGTEYTERQCNPLVNMQYKALSLDANRAEYGANGHMLAWPGDTEQQNEPVMIQNLVREQDAAGRIWARTSSDSIARGLDCKVFAGNSTIITVAKPDIAKMNGFRALFSGGNASLVWNVGTYDRLGTSLSTAGSVNGMFAFSSAPQSNGQVSVVETVLGDHVAVWNNGIFAPWLVTPPHPGFSSGATPHNTESCGVGGQNQYTLEGLIGEVRVYAGALTQAQREMVQCQLGAKWGIGVSGCQDGRPAKSY